MIRQTLLALCIASPALAAWDDPTAREADMPPLEWYMENGLEPVIEAGSFCPTDWHYLAGTHCIHPLAGLAVAGALCDQKSPCSVTWAPPPATSLFGGWVYPNNWPSDVGYVGGFGFFGGGYGGGSNGGSSSDADTIVNVLLSQWQTQAQWQTQRQEQRQSVTVGLAPVEPAPVPLPGSLAMMLAGLIFLKGVRR